MDLPANIDIEALPGSARGKDPALYSRDEAVWSPDRRHFALAYAISEASMCNSIGRVLIGRVDGERGVVLQNFTKVFACCWGSTWCRWLDDEVFVFKAQRYSNNRRQVPLVLAHVDAGFCVVPGSNDAERTIESVETYDGVKWTPWDEAALVRAIDSAPPPAGTCPTVVDRLFQVMLIVSTLVASWLGMQLVHELGHVLGALVSGGRVAHVVLNPLSFSRTDLLVNPRPLVVAWYGPIVGVVGPLVPWLTALRKRLRGAFVLRFFAGFCLVANGLYIGVGSFDGVGDCGEMLRYGSAPWQLWLFGLVTTPVGLWLWHGQGEDFGFGRSAGRVNCAVAYTMLVVCIILLLLGFTVSGE